MWGYHFYGFDWSDLFALSGVSVDYCLSWLALHGVPDAHLVDLFLDEFGDGSLDVGGYWSDAHLTIDFEDGYVVRWYESSDWE